MANIVKTLIIASEKAACVARSCCANSVGETLLIAEKSETEANSRFDKDFKTIADVLAQESAKAVIISAFPELHDDVRGEESAIIDGVTISLQKTCEETMKLLKLLVPSETATRMAEAAHCSINSNFCYKVPENLPVINLDDIGIWIDPIDATAEFIAGVKGDPDAKNRLLSVTVLIGAYLKSTGEPVIGIINQPFFNNGQGQLIWGMHYNNTSICSSNNDTPAKDKLVLLSGAEKPDIAKKFKNAGWQIQSVAGAGNKLMKVALGEAMAYIVSQGTTFRWDTCAPHSIIRAKDGNVLSFTDFVPITYNDQKNLDSVEYCNKNGIIAYTNKSVLNEIKNILS